MCTNLSIRQKLLPYVMKATPDTTAPAPITTAPPVPAPSIPSSAPGPSPSSMPVFCHPALSRNAHHAQPVPPSPMPPSAVQPMAQSMPQPMPQQMAQPTPQPMPQPASQPAPQPAPARSFGLATKGPRVVAGTAHPTMAARITKYVPPHPAQPHPLPHPAQPVNQPLPTPVQPLPTPAQPLPTPVQPAQPMAQPASQPLPTPLQPVSQPTTQSTAQPAVQPATPPPSLPHFSSPTDTPAFVTKPKPAKPYAWTPGVKRRVRRTRVKPDGFITTVGNPVGMLRRVHCRSWHRSTETSQRRLRMEWPPLPHLCRIENMVDLFPRYTLIPAMGYVFSTLPPPS